MPVKYKPNSQGELFMSKTLLFSQKSKVIALGSLLLFSALLYADTIIVGETKYTCPNTCKITMLNGVPYVYDSGGGVVFAEPASTPNVPD